MDKIEKELEKWRHEHFSGKRDGQYSGEYLDRDSQLALARHFADLGVQVSDDERDERTRQEMIAFISSLNHNYLCGSGRPKRWIAYLEKSKRVKE